MRGVKTYLSETTIEEAIFEWVIERSLNHTDLPMWQFCLPKLEERIIELFRITSISRGKCLDFAML